MSKPPVAAPESMTVWPSEDGNLLVSLTHDWSAQETISFTVKVPKADFTLTQLRELACQEVAKRLAGTTRGS